MKNLEVSLPKSFVSQYDKDLFYHQKQTLELLKQNDIVINDLHPGSGKTRASFLYLDELNCTGDNLIFYITPYNMLIEQVTEDLEKYIKRKDLDYSVFPIYSDSLFRIGNLSNKKGHNIKNNAKLLSMLLDNPINLFPILKESNMGYIKKSPIIYIINPDIFFYMLFSDYYYTYLELHNLIIQRTVYLIVDEFHFYTLFQFSSLFALLSLWKINGRFKSGKVKVCFLSATSNKKIYNDLQETIGLRCSILSKQLSQSKKKKYKRIPFLSKTKLNIHKIAEGESFENIIMKSRIKRRIKDYIKEGLYGLIICNSIRKIDILYNFYKYIFPKKVGRITGRINQHKRQDMIEKQLIFATNTVDHGFNFQRYKSPSERQEIDFIFFEASTYEDFIQRLGRGGRILGKEEQDHFSYAHIFLTTEEIKTISKIITKKTSREEKLNLFKEIYPSKRYFKGFFKKYGFFIVQRFIERAEEVRMAQSYRTAYTEEDKRQQEIIKKLKMILRQIYFGEKEKKKWVIREKRALSLSETKSYFLLSKKEKQYLAYHYMTNLNYIPSDNLISPARVILSQLNPSNKEDELEYRKAYLQNMRQRLDNEPSKFSQKTEEIRSYLSFLREVNKSLKDNFRSGSMDMQVKVLDPNKIAGSQEYEYSFLKMARHYKYKIIKNGKPQNYKKKPIIKIINERDEYLDYYFEWDLIDDTIDIEFFEKEILWGLVHFKPGDLMFRYEDSEGIPASLRRWETSHMIGYLFPNNWTIFRTNGIFIPSNRINILFPNHAERMYRICFGKDALIAKSYDWGVNS